MSAASIQRKISLEKWKRAGIFKHFIEDVRCVISVTADINVTGVLPFCKAEGRRFYPTFIYIVSKAVNSREEFKMGYNEKSELIVWDEVSPSYPVFHPEDELFTRLVTTYSPDFSTFYQRILADMEKHKDARGHEITYAEQNTFDVSCLPWLHYNTLDLHIFDSGTYLAPVITWGKYRRQGSGYTMPLTIQIHHAVADGFHIARFYDDVQFQIKCLTDT